MRRHQKLKQKPRIFLGFIEICGVYRSYENALKTAGCNAYFLNLGQEHRPYKKNDPLPVKIFKKAHDTYCSKKTLSSKNTLLVKMVQTIRRSVYKICLLGLAIWITIHFDVLIIKSGAGLTRSKLELRLPKLFGRLIVYTYHGSDSRPRYLSGQILDDKNIALHINLNRETKNGFIHSGDLCDYIVDSPLSAHLQQKKCCLRQVIGNPAPINSIPKNLKKSSQIKTSIRALHFPSSPELKGTEIIRETVKRLQKKGLYIEYREIVNRPNEEVMNALVECDFVIDELYSDNYGGVGALEAITAGKPVIVCGYAKDELNRFVPEWARMPTDYCHPDKLEAAIERLVINKDYREKRVEAAKMYINQVLHPRKVAERWLKLINGEAPDSWFFTPNDIRYVYGAAATETVIRSNISTFIKVAGDGALMLDDKPELKQEIVAFARKNDTLKDEAKYC